MPKLEFISDTHLRDAVDHLLSQAQAALKAAENEFNKNVIDPFAAVFEMAGFCINEANWRASEKTRKAQKTLSNHIGNFHQIVLGKVNGWTNLRTGRIFDLESANQKIIAEIKNKHNTIKGSNQSDLYTSLENLVMPKTSIYKDYTAYYVVIVPKKPARFDVPFVPSDKATGKRKPINPLIRTIDGHSFYDKVTGIPGSLLQLFNVLPAVIQESEKANGYRFADLHFLEGFFEAAYGTPSTQSFF